MQHYQTIAKALAYIKAHARRQPDLAEVAEYVHMSPFHFQRVFTQWAGVSPKKFLQYLTLHYAKAALARPASLAEAADDVGLSGTGRLHDLFLAVEGITPGEYKKQGANLLISYGTGTCRFGEYLVASTPRGICFLHFYDNIEAALQNLQQAWQRAILVEQPDAYHEQVADFLAYKLAPGAQQLQLHMKGTPFQLKVWEALLRIPEGRFTSYQGLAKSLQQPNAARAVGTAVGANPVAYLIPCHRVIQQVGEFGQYRWGSERKLAMLGWEAAQTQDVQPAVTHDIQLPLFK